MLELRPLPHQPLAGSVRAQDVSRLRRLRRRLMRRWARRRRRQVFFAASAFGGLAAAVMLVVLFIVAPNNGATHRLLERIAIVWLAVGSLVLAIFSIWRLDRTRRATRAVLIRLKHAEQRIATLGAPADEHSRDPH